MMIRCDGNEDNSHFRSKRFRFMLQLLHINEIPSGHDLILARALTMRPIGHTAELQVYRETD